MECFTHRPAEAVGVCKSCGKGVCWHCAIDTEVALVCGAACEQEARELHEMVDRAKKRYGVAAKPAPQRRLRNIGGAPLHYLLSADMDSPIDS
jgi:hypothetical protein